MSEAQNMRILFEKAITLQEELKADAQRRIDHYKWALNEIDKENNIVTVEPADPKMIEDCA